MVEDTFTFGGDIVWQPTPDQIDHSRLKQFMDKHGLSTFADLMHRSTTDLDWFWAAVLRDLDIEFYEPYSKVVDLSKGIDGRCGV